MEFWSVMFQKGHTQSYGEQYDWVGTDIRLTRGFIWFFTFAKLKNNNFNWLNKFSQLCYRCNNSEESLVQFLQALVQIRTASKAMSSDSPRSPPTHTLVLNALVKGFNPKGYAIEKREEYWEIDSVFSGCCCKHYEKEITQIRKKIKELLGIIKDKAMCKIFLYNDKCGRIIRSLESKLLKRSHLIHRVEEVLIIYMEILSYCYWFDNITVLAFKWLWHK